MRPVYFFFRFAILFALSAATFLSTSSFGTPANCLTSAPNARNPFGFFPTANLLFEAHCFGESSAVAFVDSAHFHRLAKAMEHEPCCFLCDPQGSGKLVRANSIFAIGDAPNGHEPVTERERRVLRNRADLVRKALSAIFAPEQVASFDFADPVASSLTVRTGDLAIRPFDFSHVGLADLLVCKVADGFDQGVWFGHAHSPIKMDLTPPVV